MPREKEHLNLVVVGHVDHGKSTLMGRLLYDIGAIDNRIIQQYEEEARRLGKESFKYAWVLDKLKEERERGLTIDISFYRFETPKYDFTIIDAPGHRDFVKNMITGASEADCAILVVSAKQGEFEAGISPGGQLREHAFLLKTLGVDQLTVAVNKMDDATVDWRQERYEEISNEVRRLLKQIGFRVDKMPFVPVSAWTGDNVAKKSDKMPWYKGPTLYESLDTFEVPPKPVDKPLRLPIQDVYSITGVGTVPVGRIETGKMRTGEKIVIMPPGIVTEVKSIEMHHTRLDEAIAGDNIGFNVKGVSKKDIRRGDMVGTPDNVPTVAEEFIGQIIVIFHPTAIGVGYTPVMHVHTAQVAVTFAELIAKINPRTGEVIEKNPSFLKTGDGALVRLRPLRPVAVEEYSNFPEIGRFAIRDMGTTVAAGIIKEITKKAEVKLKTV
jgi:elongation factor 1-alpha